MAQEKIYLPCNSYIKRAGACLIYENCWAGKIGNGNTFPPLHSLQTPHQIVQLYGYSTPTTETSPAKSQLCHASLQQHLVSVPLLGCQLLSAHTQALFCCQKPGLIYLAFQQIRGENNIKKERLNLGALSLEGLVMDLSLSPSSRPQHS